MPPAQSRQISNYIFNIQTAPFYIHKAMSQEAFKLLLLIMKLKSKGITFFFSLIFLIFVVFTTTLIAMS